MVDEIVVGFEDAVREPVVAHKLPDVFDRIELGAFWRQRNDGDICGHEETGRQVPARPAGSGPRPCPPWGRPRRRYRWKRYAGRAAHWGGCRASPSGE